MDWLKKLFRQNLHEHEWFRNAPFDRQRMFLEIKCRVCGLKEQTWQYWWKDPEWQPSLDLKS